MTNITLPLDEDIMKKAEDKLQPYGITVEEAFAKFVTDIATGQGAIEYFEIPNAKTRAAIAEVQEGKMKQFDSVEALMADLNDDEEG